MSKVIEKVSSLASFAHELQGVPYFEYSDESIRKDIVQLFEERNNIELTGEALEAFENCIDDFYGCLVFGKPDDMTEEQWWAGDYTETQKEAEVHKHFIQIQRVNAREIMKKFGNK